MLGWKVLGSCLYNVQYMIHLENIINPMQGWQKQKLLLFVLARGFKQRKKELENKTYLFSVETNANYIYINNNLGTGLVFLLLC